MKKLFTVLIVLAIFIVAGFAYFTKKEGVEPIEVNMSPIATAIVLKSELELKKKDQSNFSEVNEMAEVISGDTLRTLSSGRAVIKDARGALTTLDYDTELLYESVDEEGKSGSRILLAAGSVWASVEKLFEKGEFYEIKTGSAVAVVRGTSFGVTVLGNITSVIVATGTVSIFPLDPATGEAVFEKESKIEGGSKASIDEKGSIVQSALTNDERSQPFFDFNAAKELDNIDAARREESLKAPDSSALPKLQSDSPKPKSSPVDSTIIKIEEKKNLPINSETVNPPAILIPKINETPTYNGNQLSPSIPSIGVAETDITAFAINSVDPSSILRTKDSSYQVFIKGSGFLRLKNVSVGSYVISSSQTSVSSNTELKINISNQIPKGSYNVNILSNQGEVATLTRALVIYENILPPQEIAPNSASDEVVPVAPRYNLQDVVSDQVASPSVNFDTVQYGTTYKQQ